MSEWHSERDFREALEKVTKRPSKSALQQLAKTAVDDERQSYKIVAAMMERHMRKASPKERVHVLYALSAVLRESWARNKLRSKVVPRVAPMLVTFGALLAEANEQGQAHARKVLKQWEHERVFNAHEIAALEEAMAGGKGAAAGAGGGADKAGGSAGGAGAALGPPPPPHVAPPPPPPPQAGAGAGPSSGFMPAPQPAHPYPGAHAAPQPVTLPPPTARPPPPMAHGGYGAAALPAEQYDPFAAGGPALPAPPTLAPPPPPPPAFALPPPVAAAGNGLQSAPPRPPQDSAAPHSKPGEAPALQRPAFGWAAAARTGKQLTPQSQQRAGEGATADASAGGEGAADSARARKRRSRWDEDSSAAGAAAGDGGAAAPASTAAGAAPHAQPAEEPPSGVAAVPFDAVSGAALYGALAQYVGTYGGGSPGSAAAAPPPPPPPGGPPT